MEDGEEKEDEDEEDFFTQVLTVIFVILMCILYPIGIIFHPFVSILNTGLQVVQYIIFGDDDEDEDDEMEEERVEREDGQMEEERNERIDVFVGKIFAVFVMLLIWDFIHVSIYNICKTGIQFIHGMMGNGYVEEERALVVFGETGDHTHQGPHPGSALNNLWAFIRHAFHSIFHTEHAEVQLGQVKEDEEEKEEEGGIVFVGTIYAVFVALFVWDFIRSAITSFYPTNQHPARPGDHGEE
ncbi:uncharacterized protein LOC121423341 [Lytechinus variegatus]|uniref:uncharacterized protein LOC121423341 n=1 Tax=Lytechinus variegatus TaxID=7654 RepID=UPI001BB1F81A|nr:uncharacterized protein LOC121423341 [Lytechinus variegatus]